MDLDISRPGLYYLLNTPAVQTRIRELGIASRVCFEKGEPDEIIRLVSQAVAEVSHLVSALKRASLMKSSVLFLRRWRRSFNKNFQPSWNGLNQSIQKPSKDQSGSKRS